MDLTQLPFRSTLERYRNQATELLAAHKAGDPGAIEIIHDNHPRFLDSRIPWLPKKLADSEIQSAAFDPDDAQLTIARWYNFRSWETLAEYVAAVIVDGSPVHRFESTVEAVVAGDASALEQLLREDPELIRARSSRIINSDQLVHRATLLHYVAANGVEGYRQRTPGNAVEVARILLRGGAEVDALADMYGGHWTTMGLLVSSCHPAKAGL